MLLVRLSCVPFIGGGAAHRRMCGLPIRSYSRRSTALIEGPRCGLCGRYIARRHAPGWTPGNPIHRDEWRCIYCPTDPVEPAAPAPTEVPVACAFT